jgi:drug/metabolite transporter (DMT)-like permease
MFWLSTFILNKIGQEAVPLFFFQAFRYLLAFLVFLPFLKSLWTQPHLIITPLFRKAVFLTGGASFLMVVFTSIGIQTIPAGRASFLFALYVPMTPFFATIILKARISGRNWLSMAIAVSGMLLLTSEKVEGQFFDTSGGWGYLWFILGAVCGALQIVFTEKYVKQVHIPSFISFQLGLISVLLFLISIIINESIALSGVKVPIWGAWIYLAILGISIPSMIQNWAQRIVDSTQAALIYTLEPVFATIFAIIIAHEEISIQFIGGAVLIFIGILISTFHMKKK